MSLREGYKWDGSLTSYECIDGLPISYYEKRASDDYRDGVGVPDGYKTEGQEFNHTDRRSILVIWPNGSINTISCDPWEEYSDLWLFDKIDEWGDPCSALIIIIGSMTQEPLSYDLQLDVGENGKRTIRVDADGNWIRRFKFIGNVSHRWLRSLTDRYRNDPSEKVELSELAQYSPDTEAFPIPPGPQYTFQQVKDMEPFSGVYFCYVGRVCVYVGEGKDVTDRCRNTKDRQDKMEGVDGIGVLRVDPEHRVRMEKFYIGLLNPCRNKEIQRGREPVGKIQQPGIMTHVPIGTDDGMTDLGARELESVGEEVASNSRHSEDDVDQLIDTAIEKLAVEKTDFEFSKMKDDLVIDSWEADDAKNPPKGHIVATAEAILGITADRSLKSQDHFKLKEVAAQLGVSPSTVSKLVKNGELKTVQLPGHPRAKFIAREDLKQFMADRTVAPSSMKGGE